MQMKKQKIIYFSRVDCSNSGWYAKGRLFRHYKLKGRRANRENIAGTYTRYGMCELVATRVFVHYKQVWRGSVVDGGRFKLDQGVWKFQWR